MDEPAATYRQSEEATSNGESACMPSQILNDNFNVFSSFQKTFSFHRIIFLPLFRSALRNFDDFRPRKAFTSSGKTVEVANVFKKYASKQSDGILYMTSEDFIQKYLGLYVEDDYNKETVRLLASAADTSKDGLISFEEFLAFEKVLRRPDALYRVAFTMFDQNASGKITFENFKAIIQHLKLPEKVKFDFGSDFVGRYFGRKKNRFVDYSEFCQLLRDFYGERGLQMFQKYDKNMDGTISVADFFRIIAAVRNDLLTGSLEKHLLMLCGAELENGRISFPYFAAFRNLLSKMELVKRVYMNKAQENAHLEMTRDEFFREAQGYSDFTPIEIEVLFNLAEAAHPGKKAISLNDIERICPEMLKRISSVKRSDTEAKTLLPERRALTSMFESLYRFAMGSIAGACGATAVYPIDLVKTRMQNQRTGHFVGEVAYSNSVDCFKKVLKFEGLLGLYRGLLPQIVGVAPEKAIKLTTNDFVRDKFTVGGQIPIWAEILAGGCGGASQVVFTNPLEIVKIRLQVAGEVKSTAKVNVFTVLRELGFLGLYKGATACFLRDIPFSAIYFPAYAHAKLLTADETGYNNPISLFFSAFIAGVPAAGIVTPADVIKTRLQVAARAKQTTYDGLFDCARKVMREEGASAFWKGAGARILRSSPQFAVTLLTYELLQKTFHVDFGMSRLAASEMPFQKQLNEKILSKDLFGGYNLAAATFNGIERKFGLFMPRFEAKIPK